MRGTALLLSLFPGFRDFRTPVLVGALWCAVIWVYAQWQLTSEVRQVSGFISDSHVLRWKDHLPLGVIGVFVAYVLGVAATVDLSRGRTGQLLSRIDARSDSWRTFEASSELLVAEARTLLQTVTAREERNEKSHQFDAEAVATKYNDYTILKARLRIPAEDVYLECDKLDAEASLRVSSALPLIAGCALAWMWLDEPLFAAGIVIGLLLIYRAFGRALEARDTAREAVIARLVPHPLFDLLQTFQFAADPDDATGNGNTSRTSRTSRTSEAKPTSDTARTPAGKAARPASPKASQPAADSDPNRTGVS